MPGLVKKRELGVPPASVVRGLVSVRGQDTVYPKPAFLSTREHVSPAGSVGAAGGASRAPRTGNIVGAAVAAAVTAWRPVRLSALAYPGDSKSSLVQRLL